MVALARSGAVALSVIAREADAGGGTTDVTTFTIRTAANSGRSVVCCGGLPKLI